MIVKNQMFEVLFKSYASLVINCKLSKNEQDTIIINKDYDKLS